MSAAYVRASPMPDEAEGHRLFTDNGRESTGIVRCSPEDATVYVPGAQANPESVGIVRIRAPVIPWSRVRAPPALQERQVFKVTHLESWSSSLYGLRGPADRAH